jgi:hypothetical protein
VFTAWAFQLGIAGLMWTMANKPKKLASNSI